MASDISTVRMTCIVPLRRNKGQIEFCLVRVADDYGWGFPHLVCPSAEKLELTSLADLALEHGLMGRLRSASPLDSFSFLRRDFEYQVTAYLFEVLLDGAAASRAFHWCLAEEAQMRIRRKAVRRLVELARRAFNE